MLLDDVQVQCKTSALDMLTLEDTYQRTLVRKTQAENQQRISRAALAELLGYAQQLPSELETPDQAELSKRGVEDPKVWQAQALTNNLQLRASAKLLSAAELKLQAADKVDAPRIDVLGRTGWHSHVDERYDGRWRYDLALTVPIMDGGFKDAQVDKEKANLMRVRAQYDALTRQVRQAVLETTMQLSALKGRVDQVKVSGDFAEMYLDKSRTEYQYERKADLGDALLRSTRAELELIKLARDRAVLWEQLQGLLGVL